MAIFLIVAMLATGILGFRITADYSWTDAIYMTIITISTVGFGEVAPLNESAKLFTIFFIIISVVALGFALSVITEYIVSRSGYELLKHRKVQRIVDKLHDHVIVVGYGRNGKQAVQKLITYRQDFVVIEINEDIAERFSNDPIPFIIGNANEDETLHRAGVERARTLISALPEDADNLFVVLSARQINEHMKIISRASEESTYHKLKFAGADNVIMPDKIGGDHMASLVVTPDLVEFMDNLQVSTEGSVNVQEIPYKAVCPDSQDKTIRQIDLRNRTGCSIIGYKSPEGGYVINPEASLLVEENSKLIVIGRPEQIEQLHKEFAI
ncbi:MAG: potassium channel protein [Leeuwenhoekiella sp.]